jgi:hypothetical protein
MKLRVTVSLAAALTAIGVCAVAASASQNSGTQAVRAWKKYVTAPSQFDLALAEISFGAPARVAGQATSVTRHEGSIRLDLRGSTGLDYVAGAVTRFSVLGRPRAFVLVVNRRPRGSLAPDLLRIGLTVIAPARLGDPLLWQISNPLTRPRGLTPALCDLPTRTGSLAPSDLRSVLSRGPALSGFSAGGALAQAYDLVCRRPYQQAFRQAVTQGSFPACETGTASFLPCCPPNAICVPPPCPVCPCGTALCPAPIAAARKAAIACPLASPPIPCPL